MSHRHLLILLGAVLIALGVVERGWFLAAVWLGADFLILGVAHHCGAHRVFGKRPDGGLPLWSWLVFFPLLVYTTAVWHLVRLFSREPACSDVADGLVVGRRLLACELQYEFDQKVFRQTGSGAQKNGADWHSFAPGTPYLHPPALQAGLPGRGIPRPMQHAQHFDAILDGDVIDDMTELFQPHCAHVLSYDAKHLRHRLDMLQHLAEIRDEPVTQAGLRLLEFVIRRLNIRVGVVA